MIAVFWLFGILIVFYLLLFFLFPLGRGAIYDPSTPLDTKLIAEMARVKQGEKAADLGSGDGRVVIELAKCGAEAHGYEINPFLVFISRQNIRKEGLAGKAFIHWKSFWSADLSPYSLITVYQVDFIMKRLETKLKSELAPGSRIVSHHWLFPTLPEEMVNDDIRVYLIKNKINR